MKQIYLGVDTGGTFTDFVCLKGGEVKIHKVLSTPESPERAIVQGIAELGLTPALEAGELIVVHGSTVATNAALEGKGVPTAYVTNQGFADVLSLARQNRQDIYALQPKVVEPPVAPELCLELPCRRSAQGQVLQALSEEVIDDLLVKLRQLKPQSVAINLLYSYLNAEEEQRLQRVLQDEYFVSASHSILAESGEYERGMATWLNAWLGPKVESYLQRLSAALAPSPLAIMQSSGGTIDAMQASQKAVNLLLSGPAGGLAAARYLQKHIGQERLLTFDMGGTSTDVALIDGDINLTNSGRLGDFPVAVPMVDMHTIGAGGGSVAYLDHAGILHVGPESAGAHPGPACYGRGGLLPTVTDANAVLGRLRPEFFLGGQMALDIEAARTAVEGLAKSLSLGIEAAAQGIIDLANEHMVAALRVISVQRGYNPKEFELCCFGGAGGLHVCALAEALEVEAISIPLYGGVLSAMGMLVAPKQRTLSKAINRSLGQLNEHELEGIVAELVATGLKQLGSEAVNEGDIQVQVSYDCRYQGQSFYLNLKQSPLADVSQAFDQAHEQSFGHSLPLPLELVNVRVRAEAPGLCDPITRAKDTRSDGSVVEPETTVELLGLGEVDVYWRHKIAPLHSILGPAIICEQVSTTLVQAGWQAQVDAYGHLRLSRC